MLLDPNLYKHFDLIPEVLKVAQDDLKVFLQNHKPTEFANFQWHNDFYGEEIFGGEVEKLYTLPIIRGSIPMPEWQTLLPNLARECAKLPGIVNFTMNALSPHAEIRMHSDYDNDMRQDIAKCDRAYVILLAIKIPAGPYDKIGVRVGEVEVDFRDGDIIGFDGATLHGSWNFTDEWRFTINMDLHEDYWNI